MNIEELKKEVQEIISELKNYGNFPKENNIIDYKKELNKITGDPPIDNFLLNFAKDIIAFSNGDGGIILLGIAEDKISGKKTDIGLAETDLLLLDSIDLNDLNNKFIKITKVGIDIDLQKFQMTTKEYYYILVAKSDQILVPQLNDPKLKIHEGGIYYRASGNTEHANISTSNFNRFLQLKANERSKEFMEIWTKLLPEMFDINPKEILILNPAQNKIYGFNSKEKRLSSSIIDIDKSNSGIFNIILKAITAGEVGKITDDEGEPLFRIVGELKDEKERITIRTLESEIKKTVKYKFTNSQLKVVIHHVGWVTSPDFKVLNPPENTLHSGFSEYIWIGNLDSLKNRKKVLFSLSAIPVLSSIIDNNSLHMNLFNKNLELIENVSNKVYKT